MTSSSRHWLFILFFSLFLLFGCVPKRGPFPCYPCCSPDCQRLACPPCSHCPQTPPPVENVCDCCDIIEELEDCGVQVIVVGDTLRIVLETDMFIRPHNNQVNPIYSDIFTLIARLIRCYPHFCGPIYIVGHTDNVGSTACKLSRSCIQAHSVAAYLWANHIPLAAMKIIGYGDFEPVSGDKTMIGSATNRRIEILVNYANWHIKP